MKVKFEEMSSPEEKYLLSDSSKFNIEIKNYSLPIESIDILITDNRLNSELNNKLIKRVLEL